MNIVTGFADTFEAPDEKSANPLLSYIQVLEALEHSVQVAENAFARASKKTLRKAVPEARLLKSDDESLQGTPLWVSENTVAFVLAPKESTNEMWKALKEDHAKQLAELTENLAKHIRDVTKQFDQVIMVDALRTRIMEVAEGHYRFRVQQKWSIKR